MPDVKKILVTGGAGYIGSHTCKLLANSGYYPLTYDNLSTGYRDFVRWGPLFEGDISDTQKLIKILLSEKPLAVIHFAASAYVGESNINPLHYFANNVSGSISLFRAMKAAGVNKLVFSSSCATYGACGNSLINESHVKNPINPYGRSKSMIEDILNDLSNVNDIHSVVLRYFNAAGADKDLEIGESHNPETHLIPLAIDSAYGGPTLKIFGTTFPTDDGTAVRDYVHVADLASAHLLALNYLLKDGSFDCFNVGIGRGYSVKDVINSLGKIGLKVRFEESVQRPGDPAYLVADVKKIKEVLGWSANYVNFQDTLQSAVNWYLSRRNTF